MPPHGRDRAYAATITPADLLIRLIRLLPAEPCLSSLESSPTMLHVEETHEYRRTESIGSAAAGHTDDPLLAEAMALTWRDYRDAFDEVKDDPRADEVRATAERISEAIRSDARLSAFADRPEFVDWAVRKVAKGEREEYLRGLCR